MELVNRHFLLTLFVVIPFVSLSQGKTSLDENVKWAFEVSTGINIINSRNAIINLIETHNFYSDNSQEPTWLDQNFERIGNISGSLMFRIARPAFFGLRAGIGNYCFVRANNGAGTSERINLWNVYLNPNIQVGILNKPRFFLRGGILINNSTFHYQDSEFSNNGTQLGVNLGTTFPLLILDRFMVALNLDYFYGGKFELSFPAFGNPEKLNLNWLTFGASIWLFKSAY